MSQNTYANTQPVFRLKPTPYTNACVLKHVGYINENEKLGDEIVEFKTSDEIVNKFGKNVDYLGVIKNYIIKAYIFKNNITGSYLIKNNFLPVYSISITYEKNIVNGPLFDLFLGLKLDDKSIELKKDPKKLINATVYGDYELKILCDDSVKNNIQIFYDNIGKDLLDNPNILNKLDTMTEEEFTKYLQEQILVNKTYIEELINGKSFEKFQTITKTIENIMRPLYYDHKLDLFIKFALNKREEDRRKQYNAIENYELPKRVLNIRDVEKNKNYLNDYLGLKH